MDIKQTGIRALSTIITALCQPFDLYTIPVAVTFSTAIVVQSVVGPDYFALEISLDHSGRIVIDNNIRRVIFL